MTKLQGLGVSAGVVVGRALVLQRQALELRFRVPPESVEAELFRLSRSRAHAIRQLQEIKARIAQRAGADHAYMFDAQLLMLDDPMLIERAASLIDADHVNAEWALQRASEELTSLLRQAEDPYVRERQGDIEDVVGRLRLNLRGARGQTGELLTGIQAPAVLVADDLPPSVAAQIDWQIVVGFATDAGSWTHHTAILARSLGVPAVVALQTASRTITPGQELLLDGARGELWLEPTPAFIEERRRTRPVKTASLPPTSEVLTTADGERVALYLNLERPPATAAEAAGGEGVGLFRSEFLLADTRGRELSEAEQTNAYRTLLGRVAPREVTIRTFDLGDWTDATVPTPRRGHEPLGVRGVRLGVPGAETLMRTQIRSLLRAAPAGHLRIMFPLVAGVEEVRIAKHIVAGARAELEASGVFVPPVPIGVMIEMPSAVAVADLIAREVDFFSIGTNDLIQFGLAVDRSDERVSALYEPLHPAVLRMIRTVARVGRRFGRRTSVCGEMAADPRGLAVLIGLGLREFSMAPALAAAAAGIVRELRAADARRIANQALRLTTAAEIRELIDRWLTSLEHPISMAR